MLLSWQGGMDLSLLVFTLVSCSIVVVLSLRGSTTQHHTLKSVMAEDLLAHDGKAPTITSSGMELLHA